MPRCTPPAAPPPAGLPDPTHRNLTRLDPANLDLTGPDAAAAGRLSAAVADTDVIAGDPPVRITVIRAAADAPVGQMTVDLALHLLTYCTAPGDAVHDATADPVLAHAVTATGRRVASPGGRGSDPEPAKLVVITWPPADSRVDPVILLGVYRRRLAPKGALVVVLADNPTGTPLDAGPVHGPAKLARLVYWQHLISLYAATDGEQILPHPASVVPAGGAHQRVHLDLLVFGAAGGGRA